MCVVKCQSQQVQIQIQIQIRIHQIQKTGFRICASDVNCAAACARPTSCRFSRCFSNTRALSSLSSSLSPLLSFDIRDYHHHHPHHHRHPLTPGLYHQCHHHHHHHNFLDGKTISILILVAIQMRTHL